MAIVSVGALAAPPKGEPVPARQLARQAAVAAPPAEVWKAWTTLEGVKTFFAPDARIELKPGGAYEMYFDLAAPAGTRGGEGCTLVAIEPETRLAFTWNFPPSLPSIRNQHTQVEIRLSPAEGGKATQVSLTQTGWKDGPDWEKGYAYFERAWSLVLSRLEARFRTGPIDWAKE